MESTKILIVEEAPDTRDYLSELIQLLGYQAFAVEKKTQFMKALRDHDPDLLLLGSSCQGEQLRALAEVVATEKQGTPILSLRDGSSSSLEKDIPGVSVSNLPRNFDSADLKRAIEKLIASPEDSALKELDETIVGQTSTMLQLKQHTARLSKSDLTVLISGESGTGKELVARAIHALSKRASKPFVKVNSAALPTNLLESELFGFEKGAFTGAYQKKPGKFELAHSGTIFLDEISEIALPLQAKLLQVLEDNEVSSLGSTANTKIDVRILAATNANLGEMVREGRFRSDLFFRLNVVSVQMPPLRDRKEDIIPLCEHFLQKYSSQYGKELRPLSKQTAERLYQYDWPGNVRELQNLIQGISVLGDEEGFYEILGGNGPVGPIVNGRDKFQALEPASSSPPQGRDRRPLKEVCREAARKAETEAIVEALFHTRWNRRKAAELLKVSYKALLNKVKEYGIEAQYQELMKRG